jgi:serine/threonine protein kinase/Flp pilus assembly protein TadD
MADVLEQLRTGLSDRYTIERELGSGGMAIVYLAHDVRHDRDVALKVLKPDLAGALGAERFLTEIKLCARLQHPHIVTVLDSGETAGQLWFTMPLVEGESLRDRLNREKQLSVDEALRITHEAAEALDYAHKHGVIHRDMKPENILLSGNHALVADFGIGRVLATGEHRLTATGLSLGTPAYMSPEQAAGDRDVDGRSDIYSLATVLYEMLAGETPFTGPTSQAMIARRFTEAAKPLRQARESVPESVERAVAKALSRTAADRYATAAEFGQALTATPTLAATAAAPVSTPAHARRRMSPALTMMGLGFLLGVGVLFAWRRSESGKNDIAGRVIAVLPFENQGDAANEYFADGIADEVRGKLSALPGLTVIAGASSREYKKTTKSIAQIARELGAQYLLVGKVQWAKDASGTARVLVSPELMQVRGGRLTTRWEQPFNAAMTDVFAVQADIASKVAGALDVALGDSARRAVAAAPTANVAAYDAFLKGEAASQELSVVDPPSLRRAIGFYEQAVALDSTFARAWSRLAFERATLYFNATPTRELAEAARVAAERTRSLAPVSADAALAWTAYYSGVDHDNERALGALESGLKAAPNDVQLLGNAALIEQKAGRWDAALQHFARARALDPRSAITARRLSVTLLYLRRYPEAKTTVDSALALAPTNLGILQDQAMVSLAQGDLDGARAVIRAAPASIDQSALVAFMANYQDLYWVLDDSQQQLLLTLPVSALDGDRATWSIVRAETYFLRGDRARTRIYADSARLGFTEQIRATPNDGQRHALLGLALAYLGEKSQAIQEGERAAQLWPVANDTYAGAYIRHQLARIYALTGESDKAIEVLESLLKIPYVLSPGWLRIDPEFAMLKGNPRFERLIAQ